MKRRILTLFLAVIIITAMVLTGCSQEQQPGTEPEEQDETDQQSEPPTDDEEKPEEISANLRFLWPGTSEAEKKVSENIKTAVLDQYPNINIEFMPLVWADIEKKLTVMINTKDYPDMMMVQDVTNPVAMDALEPLDSYFNDKVKAEDYIEAALDYMRVDGKQYAIPGLAVIYSHVFNTEMLGDAGLNLEDLKSWDDIKAAAEAMTKDGKYGYAMANGGEGRFTFRDFMMVSLTNGISPDDVSDESKEQYIEVLNLFNDLSDYMPKSQVTWLYPELFKAWEANSVGMMHTGAYYSANVITHGTTNFDRTVAAPFPKGPSADKTQVMVGAAGIAIIKGSTQKDAAWKVMEVIMSPEILGEWAGNLGVCAKKTITKEDMEPYVKEAYPAAYEQHQTLMEQFQNAADEYGVAMPKILGQPQMEIVVQGALHKMLDKKITPEQAYDEIREGIERVKAELEK
jgi:multiple sugar transport system substrate-binding protein